MVKITPSRSHTRVYIHADDAALMHLPPAAYRVLRYLCNRADPRGICWPGAALISDDLGIHRQTVYDAFGHLEDCGLIVCQRDSTHDPLTGRMMAKVWQVSPYFLALTDDALAEARDLWKQANDCDRKIGFTIKSEEYTNQQQNQRQEPTPNNQHQNQQQQASSGVWRAADAPAPQASPAGEPPPQKSGLRVDNWPRQQRSTANGKDRGSARITHYDDPQPVESALSEPGYEALASNVNSLGIPLALARGFIERYGYDLCHIAWQRTVNTTADRPGGLFRYLVQRKLVTIGDVPPTTPDEPDDYSDFISS